MLPEEIKLPEDTAKKFRIVGHPDHGQVPGMKFKKGNFPMVDFTNLTPADAKILVDMKFPYLVKLEPVTKEKETTKANPDKK